MTTEHQREQADRREYLRNVKRLREQQASTYRDQYHSDIGGRFAITQHETVTGRESPSPPPLPASSPWSGPDLVGTEPPLGYRIDELEPSSLASPEAQATGPTSADAPPVTPLLGEQRSEVGPPSSDDPAGADASPTPTREAGSSLFTENPNGRSD
jgi:hypothetical protein